VTECYQSSFEFPSVKRRKVEANFSGGDITSNAGIGLMARVDRQMGLTKAVARAMDDSRRKAALVPKQVFARIKFLCCKRGFRFVNSARLHENSRNLSVD
jgi:hypothetical protein